MPTWGKVIADKVECPGSTVTAANVFQVGSLRTAIKGIGAGRCTSGRITRDRRRVLPQYLRSMTPLLKIRHIGRVVAKFTDSQVEKANLPIVEAVRDVCRHVAGSISCCDVLAIWGNTRDQSDMIQDQRN